jgi:hypothetical protein
MEDVMKESCHIELSPIRKKNSTRLTPPYRAFVQHDHRKRIETAGSLIERVLPKNDSCGHGPRLRVEGLPLCPGL